MIMVNLVMGHGYGRVSHDNDDAELSTFELEERRSSLLIPHEV